MHLYNGTNKLDITDGAQFIVADKKKVLYFFVPGAPSDKNRHLAGFLLSTNNRFD